MQRKLGSQGLVIISVHVENPKQRTAHEKIVNFLTKVQASITNVYLDEPAEFWSKRFGAEATPFAYLFDRQGRWQRYGLDGEIVHEQVDREVEKLLAER